MLDQHVTAADSDTSHLSVSAGVLRLPLPLCKASSLYTHTFWCVCLSYSGAAEYSGHAVVPPDAAAAIFLVIPNEVWCCAAVTLHCHLFHRASLENRCSSHILTNRFFCAIYRYNENEERVMWQSSAAVTVGFRMIVLVSSQLLWVSVEIRGINNVHHAHVLLPGYKEITCSCLTNFRFWMLCLNSDHFHYKKKAKDG